MSENISMFKVHRFIEWLAKGFCRAEFGRSLPFGGGQSGAKFWRSLGRRFWGSF